MDVGTKCKCGGLKLNGECDNGCQPPAASAGSPQLPEVAGRMIQGSIAEFELRCRFYIGRELEKIDSDTALIALLSDAVRLGREYSDKMQR